MKGVNLRKHHGTIRLSKKKNHGIIRKVETVKIIHLIILIKDK